MSFYEPVGCSECRDGYKGRVGIYEVIESNTRDCPIIMEDSNTIEIKDAALKQGFRGFKAFWHFKRF